MSGRYDRLLEAWMKERHGAGLQPLPEGFYAEMTGYVSELREQTRMLDRGSMRGRIAEKERENAERMLRELSGLRLRKAPARAGSQGGPVPPSGPGDNGHRHEDLRPLQPGGHRVDTRGER
jgi:hypothetical protein